MQKDSQSTRAGIIAGIASAVCVSGYITINKYIYNSYAIDALQYSLLFAMLGGVFALASVARQLDKTTYKDIRLHARSLLILSIAGCLAVGILVFGQQYTTSVNAALLVTATIVATALFSYLLLGDRLNRRQWVWIVILFIGLYIGIVGVHGMHLQKGDLIILGSVILFGFGNAFSRVIMKRMKKPSIVPDVRLATGGIIAAALALFFVRDYRTILALLPLAAVAGLLYWLCLQFFAKAIHLLDANEAIILNNSQIFFTSVIGVALLSEQYGVEKFVGSVVAIISIYFITLRKKKQQV